MVPAQEIFLWRPVHIGGCYVRTRLGASSVRSFSYSSAGSGFGTAIGVSDVDGIISYGWNYLGCERGIYAKEHAISRAHRMRFMGATITVAARHRKNGSIAPYLPCEGFVCLV